MAGRLAHLTQALLLAAIVALSAFAPAGCGVDFDPDRFCWKCAEDKDCGAAYVCRVEGRTGHCIPADLEPDESTPCDPPPAPGD